MTRRTRRRARMGARSFPTGGPWLTDPRDGKLARRIERRRRERVALREGERDAGRRWAR